MPLITGAAVIGFGALASRVFSADAWALIPRKRQDLHRPLPMAWQFGSDLVLAAVLAIALVLVAFRLRQSDIGVGVREVTFGMGAAASLLVVVDSLHGIWTKQGADQGRAAFTLPGVVALGGSLAIAYSVAFGTSGPRSTMTVLLGGAAMLLIGAGIGAWNYIESRLTHGS